MEPFLFLVKRRERQRTVQLSDAYKLTHESDPDVGVADQAQGQEVLHEVEGKNVPAGLKKSISS